MYCTSCKFATTISFKKINSLISPALLPYMVHCKEVLFLSALSIIMYNLCWIFSRVKMASPSPSTSLRKRSHRQQNPESRMGSEDHVDQKCEWAWVCQWIFELPYYIRSVTYSWIFFHDNMKTGPLCNSNWWLLKHLWENIYHKLNCGAMVIHLSIMSPCLLTMHWDCANF